MTDTLNPKALKHYRKQRGDWSQDQLAAESKISKTQISRWERGQQVDNIRPSSRDRLCKALRVRWEQLTRAPKDTDRLKLFNRVPLKGGIDGSARTFLTVVQWHFGLTEDAILDLAPLAFLILAAQSLRARQTALDEALAGLEAATAEACRRLPYMPGAFRDGYDYDWIEDERNSLKDRELLMTHEDYEGIEYSPFINFLQDQLKTIGIFPDHPIEFGFLHRGATPDYAVPTRVLAPVVALDPDSEMDKIILGRIQHGALDLSEVVARKNELSEDEYRLWLDEKNRVLSELRKKTQCFWWEGFDLDDLE